MSAESPNRARSRWSNNSWSNVFSCHAYRLPCGGENAAGFDGLDALAGGFPAGTSGRAEGAGNGVIDELEKSRRGVYAGAVGYFSANGSMDTCIALRTAVLKDGTMYVQTGAGVVADSDPAAEQAECIAKARALIRAAEEAVNFAGGG